MPKCYWEHSSIGRDCQIKAGAGVVLTEEREDGGVRIASQVPFSADLACGIPILIIRSTTSSIGRALSSAGRTCGKLAHTFSSHITKEPPFAKVWNFRLTCWKGYNKVLMIKN